ncbi:MAG: class I SAM-dependent methyltransferase [Candidatus Aminicenantes bacterium]|nr:class I SAM-dependent methyltransferase [Candidatus Aminicenantes bacterium]
MNLRGAVKRAVLEYKYFTCRGWSLKEVGDFWDSVTDYDDINESTYSYYRRFTNSWELAQHYVKDNMVMLDIQARSGKGTEFWIEKGVIKKSVLADFSDYLLSLADERLKDKKDYYESVKVLDYRLPFEDRYFDLVATYETIEHISDVGAFVRELARVLKPGGIMVLTCPNILWEPMHWLAAVFEIHHSEGPHNFLRRKKLLQLFKENDLAVLNENTTIVLPFNNPLSIKMNKKLEKALSEDILRLIGLRRSFVLKKMR